MRKKTPSGVRSTRGGNLLLKQQRVGLHLPCARLATPDIVLLKSGALAMTIQIQGYKYETAEDDSLWHRKEVLNDFLRGHGDSRFGLWTHMIRRRVSVPAGGEQPAGYARELDGRWRDSLGQRALYQNDLYATIIRYPVARGAAGFADKLRQLTHRGDKSARRASRREMIADLEHIAGDLFETLADYSPQLLSTDGDESALLGFWSRLINGPAGGRDQVALPRRGLDRALPTESLYFPPLFGGRDAMIGDRFMRVVSIKEYPTSTVPGMLDRLLSVHGELIAAQSFNFMDRAAAESWITTHGRQLKQSNDNAGDFVFDARAAANEVAKGDVCYGVSHSVVVCYGQSKAEAEDLGRQVADSVTGATMEVERLGLEPAYWSIMPGNREYIARGAPINSRNFAALSSFHNQANGQREANHWGEALALLETTGGSPYWFNWHVGDVGHTVFNGMTGAGKTTLAAFLLAQSMKYGGRRVVFDIDRGMEPACRALGGQSHPIRRGEPTGFNPLQLPGTASDRQFLHDWLRLILSRDGQREFSDEQNERIEAVVNRVYTLDPVDRNLLAVAPWLGRGELRKALARWLPDGIHGWAFNSPRDTLDYDAPVTHFELRELLDEPAIRTPMLAYMLYRLKRSIDGRPLVVYIEEAWRQLNDPYFPAEIKDLLLTLRKKNGMLAFMLQNPSLALGSEVGQLIFDQCPTQIFFPDENARRSAYVDHLGLSPRQFKLIKTTAKETRLFLVRHSADAVLSRLDMSDMKNDIRVLSARTETVDLLDRVRAVTGDAPDRWMPHYLDPESAADLIQQAKSEDKAHAA